MPDVVLSVHSALGASARFEDHGVLLREAPEFTLTQLAGNEAALKKVLGKVPERVGTAVEQQGRVLMRIGPKQIWVVGAAPEGTEGVFATLLSSGRCRIALSGERSRDVLSACAAIDFHESQFKPGQFVMSGIHHTPVLIHCIGEGEFHIYAMRTFAQAVWDWLTDAAEWLG